jgi:UDP-2-acetamido-3-amino-2,3-dideoxy-glucuronate N-acetyltransferase
METDDKFIGLIGLGYWGKNILRNLYELGVIRSACDNNPETISERKGKFPCLNSPAWFMLFSLVVDDPE